jgi:hypothetical protein
MPILENVPIFAGLDGSALNLLLEHTKEQNYSEGGLIVQEGETSNSMFVIGTGGVRVCKNFRRNRARDPGAQGLLRRDVHRRYAATLRHHSSQGAIDRLQHIVDGVLPAL